MKLLGLLKELLENALQFSNKLFFSRLVVSSTKRKSRNEDNAKQFLQKFLDFQVYARESLENSLSLSHHLAGFS